MEEDPQTNAKQLQKAVHNALRHWHKQDNSGEDLLDDLLIIQLARRELPNPHDPANRRMATNAVLEKGLDKLAEQHERSTTILRLRFIKQETIYAVGNNLHLSPDQISRLQKKAIEQLTAVIMAEEEAALADNTRRLEARLQAPTYSHLFGRAELEETLRAYLLAPDSAWIVALVGIGGIGKSALADKVVRQIIPSRRFEEIYWLEVSPGTLSGTFQSPQATFDTVLSHLLWQLFPHTTIPAATQEQRLTAVRHSLKERPTLVIIDNLETAPEMAFLMNNLYDLANPSKFLLTTRIQGSRRANVFHLEVDQLSFNDAEAFIRYYAQETGVTVIDEATSDDMAAIYQITGGNPLAIKIAVTLLSTLPLSAVLENLKTDRSKEVGEMYRRIYWQAWQVLSEDARRLLKAMPLVDDAADIEYLTQISRLTEGGLWQAIEELRQRSLLEIRGGLHEKYYHIHPLTKAFLETEIVKLPVDEDRTGSL